ncbi:MAG: hypothetical protein AAGF20_05440 [Pseudomonadota bacterium]
MCRVAQILPTLLVAALLSLSACTSIPITSMPKLASLDAETMDLSKVELAVRMQDDFDIVPESAVLSVALAHKRLASRSGRILF